MVDVTKYVLNYKKFLTHSWENLKVAGIEKGWDDWDEFVECTFDVLVCTPVREIFKIEDIDEFKVNYEGWPSEGNASSNSPLIICEVPSGIEFIKGTLSTGIEETNTFRYSELTSKNVSTQFSFCQFGHPYFVEEDPLKSFSYAWGVRFDKETLDFTTNICVEAEKCVYWALTKK